MSPLQTAFCWTFFPAASNEQPWRIVRTGDIGNFGQTFIVNPEQIISTYGQQLTVLFKETLEDV